MAWFRCNVEVTLRRPVRGADGEVEYTQSAAPALFIECRSRERGGEDVPALRMEPEFLFPPPAEVLPGDLVRCGGVDYELAAVRVCRDLDGDVVCRRCTVVQ